MFGHANILHWPLQLSDTSQNGNNWFKITWTWAKLLSDIGETRETTWTRRLFGIPGVTEAWREADFTLMSAETLISGGVKVMDGHCWGPSPMLIQDLAKSPRAHSFWMEHLGRGDHKTTWNLDETLKRHWKWTPYVVGHLWSRGEKFCGGNLDFETVNTSAESQSVAHSQTTEHRGLRPTFCDKSEDRRKFCCSISLQDWHLLAAGFHGLLLTNSWGAPVP